MRTPLIRLLFACALSAPAVTAQGVPPEKTPSIVRLAPSAFSDASPLAVRIMEQHGCSVPQYATQGEPGNVVFGDLDGDERDGDFAWLCSRADSTQLLAYTTDGGLEKLTEREPDDDFWMGWFSRSLQFLSASEAEEGNRSKRANWNMEIPVAEHGSLVLVDVEKHVRYFYYLRRVQWLEYPGIH